MPESRVRVLRRILLTLAAGALIWAVGVWISGGVNWRAAGVRITSNDPLRPVVFALLAAVAYLLLARTSGAREDAAVIARRVSPKRLALALVAFSTGLGLTFNETTAGSSDAYSYVAHADAWLAGELEQQVPIARAAPWPDALYTFNPLGFHPSRENNAIVPVTSPGLPMLMAAFKAALGHCAMFWVIPLTGGLLVWTTFLIGRRIASPGAGLGAAWLVATSPTFVSMSKQTMSDVPAGAFWGLALACLLRPGALSAFASGLSVSMALLIRSNLLPVGIWLGLWLIWHEWRREHPRWRRVAAYAAGAVPGCAIIAALNATLRGSPLASGYGGLDELFSAGHFVPSLQRYVGWLIETQSILWLAGAAALALPLRTLWPTDDSRRAATLLAGVVLTVWIGYFFYRPFEAWWFLRFMLPTWPALAVGTSVFVLAIGARGGTTGRRVAIAVLVALGLYGTHMTWRLGVFPPGEGERRYVTIAEFVARHTEPEAVVFTMQNSGAIRYYAGRLTLRYDLLDEAWLDRAVEWLQANGRPPYFLLEDWELPEFRRRFAAQNRWGREEMAPILAYKAHAIAGHVYLFDPRRPEGPTNAPPSIRDPRPRCAPPADNEYDMFQAPR